MGAAEDIRTKGYADKTPMFVACERGHLLVAQWLFEVGAANNLMTHHVDIDFVSNEVDPSVRPELRLALSRRIHENQLFIRTVLLAIRTTDTASSSTSDDLPNSPSARTRTCPVSSFSLLRGFESTVVKLVTDYAGVPYGRPLRNLREALQLMSS
jgi:hypothetical protein